MLNLLNNPTSDNQRNVLNADLFVSNLKNTLKAFGFNPKVTYEVYRRVTVYHISWNDDKDFDNLYALRKEIAVSLGINEEELMLSHEKGNKALVVAQNMKLEPLALKEVLCEFKKDDSFKIPLGMNIYDELVYLDLDKDRNLLVTGVTGSGKTNLFNNIIMNILINYHDVNIVILDSQSINYNTYGNVCEVVNDEEEIINRIRSIRKMFEERVKKGSDSKIVVFIDEIYEILKRDDSIKDDINYLLELGSDMGIHLVISSDSIINDDIYDLFKRDNLSKLSFYLTSRGEYHMFLNEVVTEKLNNDGIYVSSDKEVNRISIPLIDDGEIERVVSYYEKNKE